MSARRTTRPLSTALAAAVLAGGLAAPALRLLALAVLAAWAVLGGLLATRVFRWSD